MSTDGILESAEEVDQRSLLADLFHALNQPLSALRCSMELALLVPRTQEEYCNSLQTGLEKVEQATLLVHGIRELLEAKESSDSLVAVSLQDGLREATDHFLPVANDAGIAINSHCEEKGLVNFDPECLRRALFYIFDLSFALVSGKQIEIRVREGPARIFLDFIFDAPSDYAAKIGSAGFTSKEASWQLHLKWIIAQQLFRAQQGDLVLTTDGHQVQIQASIPRQKSTN